jgi:hypothetical protein
VHELRFSDSRNAIHAAMGFPADTLLEQSYRNHIDEVAQYLERTHGDRYMIFNLSDKQYDPVRFGNKVSSILESRIGSACYFLFISD